MKYSLPGHSCVQEVDSTHSVIEKAMAKTDFYSVIGLIRILKSINRQNPYKIIQMKPQDFKDFASCAKLLNYKNVPFSQVSSLHFTRSFSVVYFKTSYDECEPTNCTNIRFLETRRRQSSNGKTTTVFDVRPKVLGTAIEVPEGKKADIKTAFPFMPLVDREFYRVILKI